MFESVIPLVCALIHALIQLRPYDVEYGTYGITDYKLLKKAVATGGYPPTIKYAVTYKEELRRTGKPVWVCLDLLGAAETTLTFLCKAYEEKDCQQLDENKNGRLKLAGKLGHSQDLQNAFRVPVYCTTSVPPTLVMYTHHLFCSCVFHSSPSH